MSPLLLASATLLAIVLLLVLRPLWSQARGTALALALLLVGGTAGLYGLMGTPDALDPAQRETPQTLDQAIAQLERRLADEPASVEGWVLLGRARGSQGQWQAAADAFGKAQALLPDEPDLMVETADALMRAAGDARFPPDAVALLEKAVARRPGHQRGLFYLGAQRLQAGQPAEAASLWEQLLPTLEPAAAEALRPQLAMAREQAGLPPLAEPPAPAPGVTIAVRIELDPAVAAQVAAGDTLFVFARTADGAGLPVAVKRLPATGFPLELTLSDTDGLMPAQKLSQQANVRLMARVSKSGDAGAAPGDIEAAPLALAVADGAAATLVLAKVVE